MPKFFVTSDIHSFYTPLKKALDEAGFNPDDENHYLVVCGDVFDRGNESKEVLHFLMGLERKILIKGNHDILLEELCMREFPYSYDSHNGTKRTVLDLGGTGSFDERCRTTWNKTAAYRSLLVNYFETQNYIFVHSWIPINVEYDGGASKPWYQVGKKLTWMEDWRNANDVEWEEAMWGNPFELADMELNQTSKTIVFGHFHTSYARNKYEGKPEWGNKADFSIYYNDNYIAIDACCAYSGKLNVLVLEDEFLEKGR
jgi:serine/threonine protein phosphatase 1